MWLAGFCASSLALKRSPRPTHRRPSRAKTMREPQWCWLRILGRWLKIVRTSCSASPTSRALASAVPLPPPSAAGSAKVKKMSRLSAKRGVDRHVEQAALAARRDRRQPGQRRGDAAAAVDDAQPAGALGDEHAAVGQEGQRPGVVQAAATVTGLRSTRGAAPAPAARPPAPVPARGARSGAGRHGRRCCRPGADPQRAGSCVPARERRLTGRRCLCTAASPPSAPAAGPFHSSRLRR